MLRRDEWRSFLKRWSEEWVSVHDPERDAPLEDDVASAGWLGFAPASTDEIVAAEQRLGRSLPAGVVTVAHAGLLVHNPTEIPCGSRRWANQKSSVPRYVRSRSTLAPSALGRARVASKSATST